MVEVQIYLSDIWAGKRLHNSKGIKGVENKTEYKISN